jgi:plastocyanin
MGRRGVRTARGAIAALPAAILVAALAVGSAGAGGTASPPPDIHVSAYDVSGFDLFAPSSVRAPRGTTVVFDFDGPSHHTATDGTGMALFDSGLVDEGGPSLSYTYEAAGVYRFVCTLHAEMTGQVSVPVGAWPATGGLGRSFTVRWARAAAPSGFVYDVQIHRPGGVWKPWRTGVTSLVDGFVPDRGAGRYRFRARMWLPGEGRAKWSPVATIAVA